MDCLFCKIANKEIPAEIIYEDDHALAFLDIHPKTLAHVLIIPKKHYASLKDVADSEIGPLFATVKKVAIILTDRFKPDGLTIGINQGRAAGQEVDHLHIHILMRYKNDNGGSIQSIVDNPPKESLKEVRKKILNIK